MLKKIYSLMASLLVLSACTDEVIMENEPVNNNEITLSFSFDVPTATIVSKAVTPPSIDGERGVENLKLYTFKADGSFEVKAPTLVSSTDETTTYRAIISKDTRKIHFISNYGGTIQSENDFYTLSTNEYVFWGIKDFGSSEPSSELGTIDLYRNWSKLDVKFSEASDADAQSKLFNATYMVYNKSQRNTLAFRTQDEINLPAGLTWDKPTGFSSTNFGISTHLFENNNQISSGTYVIIRASYNNPEAPATYYKLDLSKMMNEGYVKVYDVIRNYHYTINIHKVAHSGVATFEEAIAEGKPADNNITASAELNDYPKITYDGETLIVSKTTYVFTSAGQTLNMQADYTKDNVPSNGLLKYVAGANLANVVNDGVVTLNTNGSITASIKNPTSTEQRAYFYITGGKLQRMITLVLRQAYEFTSFTLTQAGIGADSPVTAHFGVPADIEKAIFPLEFKFTSKKLYAVEPGVRIETGNNGTYTYVYTAQSYQAGGYDVAFKTNSPNAAGAVESVTLNAEYFNQASANLTAAPKTNTYTIAGTYNRYRNGSTNAIGGSITVTYTGGSTSFNVTNGVATANTTISLPDNITTVTLTHSTGGRTYTLSNVQVANLTANTTKRLDN